MQFKFPTSVKGAARLISLLKYGTEWEEGGERGLTAVSSHTLRSGIRFLITHAIGK